MAVDISSLPEEVLRNIFKFLNVRHRVIASRVCKTWLIALNCTQLLYDINIKIKEIEKIRLFSRMTRRFRWFSFYSVTIDNSVLEFLNTYSNQFFKLYFFNCTRDKCEIKSPNTTLNCNNLNSLHIRDSNVIDLFAPLPTVTDLEFWHSNLSDYIVVQLCTSFLNIETLSLGGNRAHDDEECERFYQNKTIETNPSNLILFFASIKMLLERNRNTLTSLDLKRLNISQENVQAISEIPDLKLRSVIFPDVGSECLKNFCENQVSLTSLNLRCFSLADEGVRAICQCLPNLQELDIGSNFMMDRSIIQIFQLEHLEKLILQSNEGILELSYQEAVSNLKAFKLKYLDLSESEISDACLFELLIRNPNIRSLDISNTSVSNKTLNMICKNLLFLECLRLRSCIRISDAGLTGEVEPASDTFTPTPLSNLKSLRELDLSVNPSITKYGCLKAIRFPFLERLYLPTNQHMFIDINFMTQMRKQNPCLIV